MTEIKFSDPSEGATYSGYYSIAILDHGEELANIQLAPELVPDLSDPDELITAVEQFKQGMVAMRDVYDE